MPPRHPILLLPPKSHLKSFLCRANPPSHRTFSTTKHRPSDDAVAKAATDISPSSSNTRWLSETKARIGKCIIFGMNQEQTRKAGDILKVLGEEWRELVAGREGFLVGRKRAGLFRQKVVWGEMDSMAHVNNVTYIRYAESARVNWAQNYAVHSDTKNGRRWREMVTPHGDGMILKSMRTDFKFPMTWPDHISVFHKLRSLPNPGDSSFMLDVMILSELHQRPSARCVEDIVMYDYKKGRKMSIRPFMMDAFVHTWKDQEGTRKKVGHRIGELEAMVKDLERETWDRDGAVEDLGKGT